MGKRVYLKRLGFLDGPPPTMAGLGSSGHALREFAVPHPQFTGSRPFLNKK